MAPQQLCNINVTFKKDKKKTKKHTYATVLFIRPKRNRVTEVMTRQIQEQGHEHARTDPDGQQKRTTEEETTEVFLEEKLSMDRKVST